MCCRVNSADVLFSKISLGCFESTRFLLYDRVHAGAFASENDVQVFDLLLYLEYPKRSLPGFIAQSPRELHSPREGLTLM